MKLSLLTRPITDDKLRLAAQIGVTDIVADNPGNEPGALESTRDQIESFDLRLSVIENKVKMTDIVNGAPGRDEELADIHVLLRNMGRLGIPVFCCNFIPVGDWSRTTVEAPERGGALVSAFDAEHVSDAKTLLADGESAHHELDASDAVPAEQLWNNLEYFLKHALPSAEDAGVTLAMHPDDPPMSPYRGYEQIMWNPDSFERLLNISDSPSNTMCFCQGSFASMGVDVIANIRRFASRIGYVHFRDVQGSVPKFQETFHDNGPTDMAAAIRTYLEIGFDGPIRPDHVPVLAGESTRHAGYTMLGRLHAIGYMQGLIEAAQADIGRKS